MPIYDGLLYQKCKLWTAKDKDFIQTVLELLNDTKAAGHLDQEKIIELVRRTFLVAEADGRAV